MAQPGRDASAVLGIAGHRDGCVAARTPVSLVARPVLRNVEADHAQARRARVCHSARERAGGLAHERLAITSVDTAHERHTEQPPPPQAQRVGARMRVRTRTQEGNIGGQMCRRADLLDPGTCDADQIPRQQRDPPLPRAQEQRRCAQRLEHAPRTAIDPEACEPGARHVVRRDVG